MDNERSKYIPYPSYGMSGGRYSLPSAPLEEEHTALPTPFQLRVILGEEDDRLLHHIDYLTAWHANAELNDINYKENMRLLWDRLDKLTK